MPRYPDFASRNDLITGSVFETFRDRMGRAGDVVALHIGDAGDPPPYELPIDPHFRSDHPGFNRYCDTFGVASLRETLSDKLRNDNEIRVEPCNVMMTAGASNALNVITQSVVNPAEEVLVLTPFWPFFRGMVRIAGGEPVEVPLYARLYDSPDLDIVALLEAHLSERTVAVYVNTPNNPSGKVLDRGHLEAIAGFSRRHGLWVISDEAYDGMTFDGRRHVSIATLPGMFERTFSVFSFSKVYMFSGLRLGYVVAEADFIRNLNKTMVHQLYGPSTLAQHMMVEAVRTRRHWQESFVRHCERVRNELMDALGAIRSGGADQPIHVPEGAYYVFFSIEDYLRDRSMEAAIEACIDAGVSVAPGRDFGRDYGTHVRICFAAEPLDRVLRAAERLRRVLEAGG